MQYREVLSVNPSYPEAHNNLGIALSEQGKLDEAVREYREELRINASFALAHNNLGNSLLDQGKLDEAIGEYREALRMILAWLRSTTILPRLYDSKEIGPELHMNCEIS